MHKHIQTCFPIAITTVLMALCAPVSTAYAQNDFSLAQASSALSAQATAKTGKAFLNTLLNKPATSFVVEFVAPVTKPSLSADPATRLFAMKADLLSAKQSVTKTLVQSEFEQLRDYDALPMSFIKVKSRRALVQLLNHQNVKAIHENKAHGHTLAESLQLIQQPQAFATGRQGTGTTVAVLDTGVNYTHPAFGCTAPGTPAGCRMAVALDVAADDGSLDSGGHGTNVAGIVAGVAPGTRLAALDVFTGPYAYTSDIVSGINWAINNKYTYNIVAINLSLAVYGVKYTSECTGSWAATPFANARAYGIIPVVAAGNDGFTDGVAEPACAPGAVRVGAVYDANIGGVGYGNCSDSTTAADKVTCFSNSSNLLTVLAPGAAITAAGSTNYGTSQAAPHVAGAIAVLRAPNAAPDDTVTTTVDRLTVNGQPVTDTRNGIIKPRLNLFAAVNSILGAPSLYLYGLKCFGQNASEWIPGAGEATRFELYLSPNNTFASQTLIYSGINTLLDFYANSGSYARVRACNNTACGPYSQGKATYYLGKCLRPPQ
jgi:subtilisin family serine protease